MKKNNPYIIFIIKFAGIFCLFYFGSLSIIGLSAPEGLYSPFVAKYLNFIDWLRVSLLSATSKVVTWLGYSTYMPVKYELFIKDGYGIRMVYSCVGYGIMSFWAAFVLANNDNRFKKISWLISGWLAIWIINVLRLVILIIALNKKWEMPLGWDHHTWFNIAAYLLIFILIYFYDRSSGFFKLKSGYPKHP